MNAKIKAKINFHTYLLKKSFNLNHHDTEDIKQSLSLKVLEAKKGYNPQLGTTLTTFLKTAIKNEAANIFNKYKMLPITENHEDVGGVETAGVRNQNFQRSAEIRDELNDANHPPKKDRKKSQIKKTLSSLGVELHSMVEATPTGDLDMAMDIQVVLEKLYPRKRRICEMLMAGHTQEEIARAIKIDQCNVSRLIGQLKKTFTFLEIQQKKTHKKNIFFV